MTKHVSLLALIFVTCITTSSYATELVGLGFLYPNDAGKKSDVAAVSFDGLVAVGVSESDVSRRQAFRWTQQTGMVGLGFLTSDPMETTDARAVSCDGSVIVGVSYSSGGYQAYRWTQQTGMIGLGFFNPHGVTAQSTADAVSCDGSVVAGGGSVPGGYEAFRWTSGTGMVSLGDLAGGPVSASVRNISYDGNVISGHSNSGQQGGSFEAFIWTAQTGMVGLGDVMGTPIGSYNSWGWAVAGYSTGIADAVIVGQATAATHPFSQAFRWTSQGGMVGLGFNIQVPQQGAASYGYAANGTGKSIVGRWQFQAQQMYYPHRAMLWDDGIGMRDIKTAVQTETSTADYWLLENGRGMSASGQEIVGNGKNPDGDLEGWLIRGWPHDAGKINWDKTESHIICCWQPPGPEPWMRVFDGSMSRASKECAPITSYEWNFGDGEKATGEDVTLHAYGKPGFYRAQLTVMDRCRATAIDVVEVEIPER